MQIPTSGPVGVSAGARARGRRRAGPPASPDAPAASTGLTPLALSGHLGRWRERRRRDRRPATLAAQARHPSHITSAALGLEVTLDALGAAPEPAWPSLAPGSPSRRGRAAPALRPPPIPVTRPRPGRRGGQASRHHPPGHRPRPDRPGGPGRRGPGRPWQRSPGPTSTTPPGGPRPARRGAPRVPSPRPWPPRPRGRRSSASRRRLPAQPSRSGRVPAVAFNATSAARLNPRGVAPAAPCPMLQQCPCAWTSVVGAILASPAPPWAPSRPATPLCPIPTSPTTSTPSPAGLARRDPARGRPRPPGGRRLRGRRPPAPRGPATGEGRPMPPAAPSTPLQVDLAVVLAAVPATGEELAAPSRPARWISLPGPEP